MEEEKKIVSEENGEEAEEAKVLDIPTTAQFEAELKRLRYRHNFIKSVWSTVSSLIVVAAIAIIISTMILPVLRVTGTSMNPTLKNDEVLLCNKLADIKQGDIIAFYYNNKVLIKRVIGLPGDVIDIAEDGTVYVNGEALDEPYVQQLALGECDIQLPYQVPESRFFVCGDNRGISIDSRSTSIGCIAEENIIGVVFFRVLPIKSIGFF